MDRSLLPRRAEALPDAPQQVPARVLESWRRSEDYGVPLDEVEPIFSGTDLPDSLFVACGNEVLAGLHRTLAGEPVSLMLTDADGLVLSRFSGDSSLLRSLDDVHLAPGFGYSERQAGTNGLGLALADRLPAVVKAEEHYSASLCTYTCAAVPVVDPLSGRLEGAVNLTTWSRSSSDLLLALAQAAAGNTEALMLASARGRTPRPAPRGEVFRVRPARLEPGAGSLRTPSAVWAEAVDAAEAALCAGRVVAAVGERGSGRTTLLAQALRRARPRDRVLEARPPAPQDVDAWLALWTPELRKADTSVVVGDVGALAPTVAERLRPMLGAPSASAYAVTADALEAVPASLRSEVDVVVRVPPLRERSGDVMLLAHHVAARVRGREVDVTAAAARALETFDWPGNVTQLVEVVREAVTRADVVDVQHLPSAVRTGGGHRLSRIEQLERDEIVRVLARPGVTMRAAADGLGMSRATLYRKVARYGVRVERR